MAAPTAVAALLQRNISRRKHKPRHGAQARYHKPRHILRTFTHASRFTIVYMIP